MRFLSVCSNVNPYHYQPKGTTLTSKCGSFWFVMIWIHTQMRFLFLPMWIHITTNHKEPHLHQNVVPFGFWWCGFIPKSGSFWFVVIWMYTKTWFLLVCSNVDPSYYEPKGTTNHIYSKLWFLSVCSDMDANQNDVPFRFVVMWILITTNQKGNTFTPKCGSLRFVIWIYTKMWFLLVCSSVDPYYYKLNRNYIYNNMWLFPVGNNMDLHQNVVPSGL